MKEITVETVKLVNIKETVLYYIRLRTGKETVTIKTDKNTFSEVEKLIGKKEVKAV